MYRTSAITLAVVGLWPAASLGQFDPNRNPHSVTVRNHSEYDIYVAYRRMQIVRRELAIEGHYYDDEISNMIGWVVVEKRSQRTFKHGEWMSLAVMSRGRDWVGNRIKQGHFSTHETSSIWGHKTKKYELSVNQGGSGSYQIRHIIGSRADARWESKTARDKNELWEYMRSRGFGGFKTLVFRKDDGMLNVVD